MNKNVTNPHYDKILVLTMLVYCKHGIKKGADSYVGKSLQQ